MSTEKLPPDGYELGPGWVVFNLSLVQERYPGCLANNCKAPLPLVYHRRFSSNGCCEEHALAMGAIVRKAEAPTPAEMDASVRFVAGPGIGDVPIAWPGSIDDCKARVHEALADIKGRATPPEQPSGNSGELLCACGTDRATDAERCPTCASLWDNHEDEECSCYDPNGVDPDDVNKCPFAEAEAPAAPVGETGEEACARLGIDVRQWAAEVRAKVAAAMPMPAAVVLEVVIKAMTINFGQVYDGPSVCAEDYGLIDRLRGIYKNPGGGHRWAVAPIQKEAADRITALEARLASALTAARGFREGDDAYPIDSVIAILEGKT